MSTSEATFNTKYTSIHRTHTVLSKVDDFATFKKVEVHANNSTFRKVEVV